MKTRILLATTICLLLVSLSVASADPIRIMPLGDSITLGYSASVTDNNYRVGYRQKLYLDLVNSGYDIHFVGSLSSGMLAQPPFDVYHEGHGGWCADGCSPPSPPHYFDDIRDHVFTFLTDNPADVVLLHIGTNDISGNNQNAAEVGGILDEIYRYSPDITVVLARIISRTDGKDLQTTQFNDAVEALMQGRIANGDKIIMVDMESALNYPADMAYTLHPNQTGYEKMANVWLEALQTSLIRLLTVQKAGTGQGRVTSIPGSIDCGSICSDSFQYGTVVILNATADIGSTISNWVGSDSVNGNTCAVALNSNLNITAIFRAITEVKLLSPNSREIIPAGSEYPISWEAPREAVTFKLSYFPGRTIVRGAFGNSHMWAVPLGTKNKTTYLKVSAHDSSNRKIGSGESGTFTIEGARITFPNQGNICTGGQTCTITWSKSEHVPANSAHLSYTLDGITWHKIPDILPGNAESFDWITPAVKKPKTKCKVKVVLRDSDGKKVGSDVSDGHFTLQPTQ